jgi:hypothetical protein
MDIDEQDAPIGDANKIELTEREILLAQGDDPDSGLEPVEKEDAQQVESEADAGPGEADPPAEEKSWITDADREKAKAYGLSDEDLGLLETREEFGRFVKLSDAAASRKPDPTADDPADEDEEEAGDKPLTKDGRINVQYYKDNDYDDGTVAAMEAMRKAQDDAAESKSYLSAIREQQEAAEYARHINEFHDAADELRPDHYGDSNAGKLSAEFAQRRTELYEATRQVAQFIAYQQQEQGKPISVPPLKELVKRAEALAFGGNLPKGQSKPAATARTQGNRVRPVGSSAGAVGKPQKAASGDPADIANDPDVIEAWNRAQDPMSV